MSLIFKTNDCSFIDHRDFIQNLYKNIDIGYEQKFTFTVLAKLFCIKSKEKSLNRKRGLNSEKVQDEATSIKTKYLTFIDELSKEMKLEIIKMYDIIKTEEVRILSQELFESTIFDHNGLSGGNNSDEALRCKVKDDYFFIPPRSSHGANANNKKVNMISNKKDNKFFCGDVKEQSQKLEGSKFDLIIVDPPWWNKYIRRLKNANDKLSYKMMYNEDIASIPVKNLLFHSCLVAIWCTNAPSNIAAVKDLIFPKWGVEYITTWYWLKVNIDLQPLCDFGYGCKKQPYERLILGKIGNIMNVPENHLVVSIPSALHSHKPPLLGAFAYADDSTVERKYSLVESPWLPVWIWRSRQSPIGATLDSIDNRAKMLIDLLKPFVAAKDPQVLELFARYLLPNTTSVGFEPLKWQHVSLYDKVS